MEKVTFAVEGTKVPLKEIREKMLSGHAHYNLTRQQITVRLEELHEFCAERDTD